MHFHILWKNNFKINLATFIKSYKVPFGHFTSHNLASKENSIPEKFKEWYYVITPKMRNNGQTAYTPTSIMQQFPLPTSLPTCLLLVFLLKAALTRDGVPVQMQSASVMANDANQFCMHLLAKCSSSLRTICLLHQPIY